MNNLGWYLNRCRTVCSAGGFHGCRSLEDVAWRLECADWSPSAEMLRHYESGKCFPERHNLALLAFGYCADVEILYRFYEIDKGGV